MIYHVFVDGVNVYEPTEGLQLQSPKVSMGLEDSGSSNFTMPCNHEHYNLPKLLTSDIEVYEYDDLIWYGRVIDVEVDMYKNKKITGEGAYSYFNDSILRPRFYDETTIYELFRTLIGLHNSQVPANRQFAVGEITVEDDTISANTSYDTTKKILDNLRSSVGGYYTFTKNSSGQNIINWYADIPNIATQPIVFGINLVDISQHFSGSNMYTSIIPLGKEVDGEKVTIAEINDGLDYIDTEAVDTYGRITTVVEFSDISNNIDLKAAGEKWLANQSFDPLKIECRAAEMSYIDESQGPFKIGQKVRVMSSPHLIDTELPLMSINISLDSAVKEITVGTPDKTKLTQLS